MKDALGDRMKGYENVNRNYLINRTYTILRLDGKSFHTYTKGLKKPFDDELIEDMNKTAIYLCKNISGAKFAFVQSDEISILLTDFDKLETEAWFNNNIQKIVSISASLATAEFNRLRLKREFTKDLKIHKSDENDVKDSLVFKGSEAIGQVLNDLDNIKFANFDSRVFQIPQRIEVENYFIWRQQDWTRNSIQAVAQSLYKHKELNGKNSSMLQEMIFQKGINWNDYAPQYKRGRIITKKDVLTEVHQNVIRSKFVVENDIPIFTQDREFLSNLIPTF